MWYVLFIVVGLLAITFFGMQNKSGRKKQTVSKSDTQATISAFCPYCEFEFEKKPKRNLKCPSCQKKILIRDGKLLTEAQAKNFDTKKYAEIGRQIESTRKRDLIKWQKSGVVKYVEISSAGVGSSCDACVALDGKRLILRDELRNPTLPIKNCTGGYGYCRCTYLPIVD